MLAVAIFLFDNLRGKRAVPLTKQVLHVLKILAAHWLKIDGLKQYSYSHTVVEAQSPGSVLLG